MFTAMALRWASGPFCPNSAKAREKSALCKRIASVDVKNVEQHLQLSWSLALQ
jgi:hypothetical protein